MQKETHAVIGATSALYLTQPTTKEETIVIACIGTFAGMLPDCDIGKSTINKIIKFFLMTIVLFLLGVAAIYQGASEEMLLKLYSTISEGYELLFGIIIFTTGLLASFASTHRGFSHSIVGLIVFSVAAYLVNKTYALNFMVGYLSHIIIDFINMRGEALFWPKKKRYCLHICKADSIVNSILFIFGVIQLTLFLSKLF